MVVLWFLTALFGMGVITYQLIFTPEYVELDGLFGYVGVPMSGGIVSYLIKSAIENKQKIMMSPCEEPAEDDKLRGFRFSEKEEE